MICISSLSLSSPITIPEFATRQLKQDNGITISFFLFLGNDLDHNLKILSIETDCNATLYLRVDNMGTTFDIPCTHDSPEATSCIIKLVGEPIRTKCWVHVHIVLSNGVTLWIDGKICALDCVDDQLNSSNSRPFLVKSITVGDKRIQGYLHEFIATCGTDAPTNIVHPQYPKSIVVVVVVLFLFLLLLTNCHLRIGKNK